MAHTKSGGVAKNLTDSNAQYLGIKLSAGQTAKPGSIILRQRGTKFMAGQNVMLAKNHDLLSLVDGKVSYKSKRKIKFDGRRVERKVVSVA